MIRPGICSVTFRALPVQDVIDLTAAAGLACIEWGGDVHVPPGEAAAAAEVRRATLAAGLEVASYGSYLRCSGSAAEVTAEAEAVVAAAAALGAPRIRIWAGTIGSADASGDERSRIVAGIRATARIAASRGIELGLEWHGGTLTDEIGSTLSLLEEIRKGGGEGTGEGNGKGTVLTYWQPHQNQPTPDALEDLRRAVPEVSTAHVFSWWPGGARLPLAERSDLWGPALTILGEDSRDHDALLEFLPEDDPQLLVREAATLRSFLP